MRNFIIVFILGAAIGACGVLAFFSAGESVAEIRARAELAEAELTRLTNDYNKATAEFKFATDGVRQSARRVGQVSDEISSRVARSLSTISELREINRQIQESFNDIANNCRRTDRRDAD